MSRFREWCASANRDRRVKMQSSFELYVSYSQIAVFWSDLKDPLNSWTDEQVELGFSQRPGSVSFKTSAEFGSYSLEVLDGSEILPDRERITVIDVLFEVPESGIVEVASITEGHVMSMAAGIVQLRFEEFKNNAVRLSFLRPSGLKGDVGAT